MRKTTLKERVKNQINNLKFELRHLKDDKIYTAINDRMANKYVKNVMYFAPEPKKSYKKASVIAFNINKKIVF
jgi:hypothetical protein